MQSYWDRCNLIKRKSGRSMEKCIREVILSRSQDSNICNFCENGRCSNKKTGMKVPNVQYKIQIQLREMEKHVSVSYKCTGFKPVRFS